MTFSVPSLSSRPLLDFAGENSQKSVQFASLGGFCAFSLFSLGQTLWIHKKMPRFPESACKSVFVWFAGTTPQFRGYRNANSRDCNFWCALHVEDSAWRRLNRNHQGRTVCNSWTDWQQLCCDLSGHYLRGWSESVNVIGVISEPFAREFG